MKTKILVLFLVICLFAAVECKKGKKRKGGSKESSETQEYETCDNFCERREREKMRDADRQRSCQGRRNKKKCRKGSRERNRSSGSKERSSNSNNRQREMDCTCEERSRQKTSSTTPSTTVSNTTPSTTTSSTTISSSTSGESTCKFYYVIISNHNFTNIS